MNRIATTIILLLSLCISSFPVPAKRGVFKTLTLADGTCVTAELHGDEHLHYWISAEGQCFAKVEGKDYYANISKEELTRRSQMVRLKTDSLRQTKRKALQKSTAVAGARRGLVVLVQFADVSFAPEHNKNFYESVCNGENFSSADGFVGSVRDYFHDQSDGRLDYSFDVVGPVTLSAGYSFYGANDASSTQTNMKQFLREMLNAIKDQVDFSLYDNDDDGVVDQIYFLYAGQGEADSDDENTIWPHAYYIKSGYGMEFSQNGVTLDTYACSNEMQGRNDKVAGIGTICHEFAHCLGLPDMYDTSTTHNYGTDHWDLMAYGSYLGEQFRPCGFTAYEREFCGWRDYELLSADCTISDALPLSEGGKAYIITNEAHPDEYFILEPRRTSGWDASLPSSGLLIYHVDYDANAWLVNMVNTDSEHQHCAIIAADDDYNWDTRATDAYPYLENSEFSDKSVPIAKFYHANAEGSCKVDRSVYGISKNADEYVSFSFMNGSYRYDNNAPEGALFYESFNRCAGTGGNDGAFGSGTGSADFVTDNDGWQADNAFGASQCAKFGTDRVNGVATSPEFNINGMTILTFRVAPHLLETTNINFSVEGNAVLGQESVKMNASRWTEVKTTLQGTGPVRLSFSGKKRWFLDEILVMPDPAENIIDMPIHRNDSEYRYNLSGQRVNNSFKGIVIIDGRKYVTSK